MLQVTRKITHAMHCLIANPFGMVQFDQKHYKATPFRVILRPPLRGNSMLRLSVATILHKEHLPMTLIASDGQNIIVCRGQNVPPLHPP